jgi:FtsP/CotA-like multicopper oxidase with cupredoxin domain
LLVVLVVVVLFLIGGAILISKNIGGGGQAVTINLNVKGSTMTPSTPAARQGDVVTMVVTADKEEEIHLHGYDIPFEVPSAGGKVSHTFKADKSGSFEIEIEETSTHLGQFDVNP